MEVGAVDCIHLSKMRHVGKVEVDQANIRPALARGRQEAWGRGRDREVRDAI